MAHKTLIGGTEYKVSGGKTLVEGTAYKISGGKTLVEGTSKSISFSSPVTVSLATTGNSTYTFIRFNGFDYYQSGASFVCNPGDVITVYTRHSSTSAQCSFMVDGTIISSGNTSTNYTIPEGITNISARLEYSSNQVFGYSRVRFTTS